MNTNGKIFEGATFAKKPVPAVDMQVPGEKFFDFFNKKSLKLGLAILAGGVGVIGNYYALNKQIGIYRPEMQGFMRDLYAIGLTGMLDLMIVIFHLMKVPALTITTTLSAVMISMYANVSVISESLNTKNTAGDVGAFIMGLLLAIIPIVILTYLMHLVMAQYDDEKRKASGQSV